MGYAREHGQDALSREVCAAMDQGYLPKVRLQQVKGWQEEGRRG